MLHFKNVLNIFLPSTTNHILSFGLTNFQSHLHIEQVQHYKYLGSIINDSNSIEEEIKERLALGIKAYYANQKFFQSRLVTKYSKLKLYRTVIGPIVTYASETWVLKRKSNMEN